MSFKLFPKFIKMIIICCFFRSIISGWIGIYLLFSGIFLYFSFVFIIFQIFNFNWNSM